MKWIKIFKKKTNKNQYIGSIEKIVGLFIKYFTVKFLFKDHKTITNRLKKIIRFLLNMNLVIIDPNYLYESQFSITL